MSCSLYRWTEECDRKECVGDCDLCKFEPTVIDEPMPCPFCGGMNLEFTDADTYYMLLGEHGTACISVKCRKCSLELYEHSRDVRDYFKKKAKLVKKWNTRYFTINGENLI